jgi:hypothetical protein
MSIKQNFNNLMEVYKSLVKTTSLQVKLPSGCVIKFGAFYETNTSDLYLTVSALSTNTLYYVYAYMNSGVMTLTYSTSAPSVMGATYKIVGALYSDGSSTIGSLVNPFETPSSDDTLYTASSLGFGTLASQYIYWSRIGDKIRVHGYATAGTVDGNSAYIALPGLTIDFNKIRTYSEVGTFARNATAANNYRAMFVSSGDSTTSVFVGGIPATAGNNPVSLKMGSDILANGDGFTFDFTVPISGFDNTPLKDK